MAEFSIGLLCGFWIGSWFVVYGVRLVCKTEPPSKAMALFRDGTSLFEREKQKEQSDG